MQEKNTENADQIQTGRLVKTRLCYHFMSYGCLRGSRCRFAHGINDLRVRQPLLSELLDDKDKKSKFKADAEDWPVARPKGEKKSKSETKKSKKDDASDMD